VTSLPGASSLMMILSLSGLELKEFHFRGFIPAKKELREKDLLLIKKSKIPVVLMDTPYRFRSTLEDLKRTMPEKNCILGMDLTAPTEKIITGRCSELAINKLPEKSEFILILS
jgi:16S rRNA (cytidine1402-2'-O)-methyltransferase